MTLPHLHRSSGTLARSALLALALAGCAGAAASEAPGTAAAPQRTAVLAGADAPRAAIDAATRSATGAVIVRHADGTFDAQAQATRLAAEGFGTIVGVGAQARAAVAQAASAEVGDGTRWENAAH